MWCRQNGRGVIDFYAQNRYCERADDCVGIPLLCGRLCIVGYPQIRLI